MASHNEHQHPQSYKAYAIKKQHGDLEPIDITWKDPQAGQIVVKVLACGVCASDEITKHGPIPPAYMFEHPRVPGHEIVGDVVAVGPNERRWKVGDRVGSGWHGGHCGLCASCRTGDFVTCENQTINGIHSDGGYAEYATLNTEAVASIPRDIDPAEAAPLLCAGITTFNSIRGMNLRAGDIVAVQGIGGLGHLALQFSHAMGYRTVALSSSESKRELATKLGASDYIDGSKVDQAEELQKFGGAKVIVCTAPNAGVIEKLLPGLAVNGTLLVLAVPQEAASIPLVVMISKRLSIRGWPSGTAKDSEDCVEFAQRMGVKCMITKFPLDKANEAYNARATARFRGVIVP